ncbi:101aa long hypothetical protein [Pyrococcus horikoshii OT3]|uniref:Uncharacterized protein n=1 Tax=Pyrococcus horikoshii (strain ATCC 700860 / DSM 12428 / JCM 9974 / NBRC 100139 / OT-3) TaxID=70601 RepID=O58435_PYRHO|nr:101aa long hypothetical protein [Pyrococcus horikoshii OT3]
MKSVENISESVVIVGTVTLSGSKFALSARIAMKYAIHITPNVKSGYKMMKVGITVASTLRMTRVIPAPITFPTRASGSASREYTRISLNVSMLIIFSIPSR